MATQITEDEDRLRRRARRRLIGAVALTLIVVIALPMILDSEPKPVGQNIELTIPNKDKVGEFVPKMDLPAVAAPTPTAPAVSAPVAAPAAAAPVSVADSQPASAPATIKASTAVTAMAEQNNPPEVKPEVMPGVKSVTKPVSATKPTPKAHAVPKAGFVVQIGAFFKTETAENWKKKLGKRGFKVYTEQVDDKIRVRVGPYPTHEAAEKSRRKLEAEGLHPNIVELHE